jgi:Holliday junction resolvase
MSYTKGSKGENELGDLLSEEGYVWMRAPGSGTANRELPDVIVGKDGHIIVFEVKRWSHRDEDGDMRDYEYVTKKEVEDLIYFAENFGAEYYVAYRFDYHDWEFVKKDEMKETKKSFRCERNLNVRSLSDICKQ